MKEDGDLAHQIKQLIRNYIDAGGKDVIPLYVEKGVYNGWLDRKGGKGDRAEPIPLCEDPAYAGNRNPMPWWDRSAPMGTGPPWPVPHRQA